MSLDVFCDIVFGFRMTPSECDRLHAAGCGRLDSDAEAFLFAKDSRARVVGMGLRVQAPVVELTGIMERDTAPFRMILEQARRDFPDRIGDRQPGWYVVTRISC